MEKTLIVSNQQLLFKTFDLLIRKYFPDAAVSKACCSGEVISSLRRERFTMVIIDMNITKFDSLELFLMLTDKTKTTKVLIVNVQPDDEIIFELHRLGVSGLLSITSDEEELVKAISAIQKEGKYFSAAVAEKLFFDGIRANALSKHNGLTTREIHVMIMLGKGKSIKEIAEHIYLSDKTISTYKARVYQKMGFQNDSDLVGYLIDHSLL